MDWASIHLIEAIFGQDSDGLKFIFIKPESLCDADRRWEGKIYHHQFKPKYLSSYIVFILCTILYSLYNIVYIDILL